MIVIDSKGKEKIVSYKYRPVCDDNSNIDKNDKYDKYDKNETYERYGIRYVYNDAIDSVFIDILKSLTYIEFCPSFNNSIDNLPHNITSIVFSINSEFNQPINNLPSCLQHLELYDAFNQPLDNLPNGLRKLIINADFNHSLDNLPASLEHLQIRGEFNHPLNNLPQALKILEILDIYEYDGPKSCYPIQRNYGKKTMFNHPLVNLPHTLEYLIINSTEYTQPLQNLPDSIKELKLHKKHPNYPGNFNCN